MRSAEQGSLNSYRNAKLQLERDGLEDLAAYRNSMLALEGQKNQVSKQALVAQTLGDQAEYAKTLKEIEQIDQKIRSSEEVIQWNVSTAEANIADKGLSEDSMGDMAYVNIYGNKPYYYYISDKGGFTGIVGRRIPLPTLPGGQMTTQQLYEYAQSRGISVEQVLDGLGLLPEED